MKRIDKFAVALVAAWILQAVLSPAIVRWYATGAENGKMVTTNAITMMLYVDAVRCILVGVVCGVWLFVEVSRVTSKPATQGRFKTRHLEGRVFHVVLVMESKLGARRTGSAGAPSGCEADAPARRKSWRAVPPGAQAGRRWCRAVRFMYRRWVRRAWVCPSWCL